MSVVITTPQPWAVDQVLVASDGSTYIASGANSAKPQCEVLAVQGPPGDQGPQGPTGNAGADGANGVDGEDGSDGFSPTADCAVANNVLTINVTTENGTTQKVLDVCPDDGG